ncbi:MAG: hypothetical protein AAGC77_00735 [Pseudomonadota bacterium]
MTPDSRVIVEKRFCGPAQSGNGGYCAGLFSRPVKGPAQVKLKAPPPLDTPIAIRAEQNGAFAAFAGETLIAQMTPATLGVTPPPIPDDASINAARESYLENEASVHVIPGCFVCGPNRQESDGLRIFAGATADSNVNADFWTPGSDLAGEDGLVKDEFLWAALDCPSYFALRLGPVFCLLGSMTAEVYHRPEAGVRLTVLAWPKKQEGRKHFADSAIFDSNNNLVAAANALWIEIADPALRGKLNPDS